MRNVRGLSYAKGDQFFLQQFLQKHGILIETSILKEMPDALSAPYPEMLYVQAKILKVKVGKLL